MFDSSNSFAYLFIYIFMLLVYVHFEYTIDVYILGFCSCIKLLLSFPIIWTHIFFHMYP